MIGEVVWTSASVALWCVVLSALPAVALGYLLARRQFLGKTVLSALLLSPLVMPPVVTGYLLLLAFGRGSPLGGWLHEHLGLSLSFNFAGAVLAAAVVGFPLFVATARVAIDAVDVRLEELARVHGAGRAQTFFQITLPLALPGIAAGAAIAFARALGEFGATVVLAGNIPGETRTIALAVYTALDSPGGDDVAITLTALSVGMSVVAIGGYEWLLNHQRRLKEDARLSSPR